MHMGLIFTGSIGQGNENGDGLELCHCMGMFHRPGNLLLGKGLKGLGDRDHSAHSRKRHLILLWEALRQ